MAVVASVLGHELIASSIARSMEEGTDINVIQGPPGGGKSWLAKGIGGLWEAGHGSTLVAEGDFLQSDTPYYPLNLALARLARAWSTIGSQLVQAASAGEQITGTDGLITATIQTLLSLRPTRQRARKMYLGESEQAILFELERLAKKRPLLLIADNLHWWDSESLEFLGRLREAAMATAFPFLAEMRVIATRTIDPYQFTVNPASFDALLLTGATVFHNVPRPSREVFPDLLTALGAHPQRAAEAADDIFNLTGGHLLLAARCATRMQGADATLFLSTSNGDDFLQRLLTDRVRSLGSVGSSALAILQVAAVLGLRFPRAELVCAFGGDGSDASRLLRNCRDEDIIELSEDVGRFVHDLFRQHFLGSGPLDTTSVHEKVSDCLRLLRPGDYQLRCRHAHHAEHAREAAVLAVQAALQRQRERLPWREVPSIVLAAIKAGQMTDLVETLELALEHLLADRFFACQSTLDGLPRNLPRALVAEVEAIRATCLVATRSEDDRDAALALLDAWAHYETEEPELGIRLMQIRLYALTLETDKNLGRVLESQIRQALMDRGNFDQAAEDAMYTLDRCSGSLHEPEVSLVRIREATRHFGPVIGQTIVRRPIEYYRCLVNLGAKLVTNALYQEAVTTYVQLEALVADYAPGTFPRLDYPRSAGLLAEFRLGMIDVHAATSRQRELAATDEVLGDPFYVQNALAVYLTLAGEADEALQIFDDLGDELSRRSRPAPSMFYLIQANRCAVQYVAGDMRAALQGWAEISEVVQRIPYLIRRYLILRHELLGEVMERGEALSPREFDECLLGVDLFGRLWDQVGRGFRMPEVEWWY